MKSWIAALLLITLVACKKERDDDLKLSEATVCVEGVLNYGDPAVDGPGWYLVVGDSQPMKTYMILERSIPDSLKQSGLSIEACMKETNMRYHYVMSATPSDENYWFIVSGQKK